MNTQSSGHCMSIYEIQKFSTNYITKKITENDIFECCELNSRLSNYCFKWTHFNEKYFSCLPARYTIEQKTCLSHSDCRVQSNVCIQPISNATMLIKISHNKGKPILFVGTVNEIIYSSILFFNIICFVF